MSAPQKLEMEPSSSENKQLPTPPPEPAVQGQSESRTTQTDEAATTQSEPTNTDLKAETTEKAKEDDGADKKIEDKESDKSKDDKKDDKSKDDKKDDSKSKDDEKDDKKEEKKKTAPKGMKAAIKTLFAKGDNQCKCCTTWVEKNPDEDSKNVEESDECLQHAVVVRKKKKHEGNRKPLKVDSIVVHSPLLKKALQKLFKGYPDLVIDIEELVFEAPFAPFFHRWDQFEQLKASEEDPILKDHLSVLHEALSLELTSTLQRHKDLIRHKMIDFDILWTLFAPGKLMFSHDAGHDRLYITKDCEYYTDTTGPKFAVRCDMIDWDGEKFGKVVLSEVMNKFKGVKKISALASYPLEFHAKAGEIKQKCIDRGKKFHSLCGVHCKDYQGTAIEYSKFSVQTVASRRHIEGRIMLDEQLFTKFNPDEAQTVKELEDDDEAVALEEAIVKEAEETAKSESKEDTASTADKQEEVKEGDSKDEGSEKSAEEDTVIITIEKTVDEKDDGPEENADDEVEAEDKEKSKKQDLDDEQLAICNSWLRGYTLSYQKWATFSVDDIRDVEWNEKAFEEVALPPDYRELILATIQSQVRQNQAKQEAEKKNSTAKSLEFDDFIRGKGRGYIMLFSGNPGVGKTATAESIAELLHVPLCMISVGNLGTSAESVEAGLQDVLEIAAKWSAVLLLDEADIFLEQRTKHDLHRNAVVSVFLRLLEYYQGVLCLTTNRSEDIDVAFHSRIHISLPFPDLSEANREAIWKHFAKMTNKKAEMYQEILDERDESNKMRMTVTKATEEAKDEAPVRYDLSASDFRKLAQQPLNGRQIKNINKTAVLLASYKKKPVTMKEVKIALKTLQVKNEQINMYN